MAFVLRYKPLFEGETKISKSLIKPRNMYRIVHYEYVDGTNKILSGPHTSYVFAIGIFEKKLHCLKITEVLPDRFFRWFKTVFQKSVNEKRIDEAKQLSDIIVRTNITGNTMYNTYIGGKQIMNPKQNPYRTYLLSGILQVSEIRFKKEVLKQLLGIKPIQTTTTQPTGTDNQ